MPEQLGNNAMALQFSSGDRKLPATVLITFVSLRQVTLETLQLDAHSRQPLQNQQSCTQRLPRLYKNLKDINREKPEMLLSTVLRYNFKSRKTFVYDIGESMYRNEQRYFNILNYVNLTFSWRIFHILLSQYRKN